MKKSDSQKRTEETADLIARAIIVAIENMPALTYGEILLASCQVMKRYSEYLCRAERDEQ
jgi:hypothetical protein